MPLASRFLSVCVGVPIAASALGQRVMVEPIVGQAITEDGSLWTVDTDPISLNASRFSGTSLERRGLLEYDLSGLPTGATIVSVTLQLGINSFTGGAGPAPRVQFHAYSADGAIAAADATVPFNLAGESPEIDELLPVIATLDPDVIAGAIEPTGILGLMAYQAVEGRQAQFYATDRFGTGPVLTVDFETDPGGTIVLTPLDDGAVERTGLAPWTLTTDGFSLTTGLFPSVPLERRAMLEFPTAGLPATPVTSARLRVRIALTQTPQLPAITCIAYPGDGVISAADADALGTDAGTSQPLPDLATEEIPLDPAAITIVLEAGTPAIGLSTRQANLNTQVSFLSLEGGSVGGIPELELEFASEPCPCDTSDISESTPGEVNIVDLLVYLDAWLDGDPVAERTGDDAITVLDLLTFLDCWLGVTAEAIPCP